MNVLKTARAVIIDDQPDQMLPILTELGAKGVAAIVVEVDDDLTKLPSEPYKGIRVVFLDLNLREAGPIDLTLTLSVLDRVIDTSDGYTGIICWTENTNDVEDLKIQITRDLPEFKPVFIESLSKAYYRVHSSELIPSIRSFYESDNSLMLLSEWEESIHKMTTHTSSKVRSSVAGNEQLLSAQAALARGIGGRDCADRQVAILSYHEGMNNILVDAVGDTIPHSETIHCEALVSKIGERVAVDLETSSKLNTPILVEQVEGSILKPGNIYIKSTWGAGFPMETGGNSLCRCLLYTFFAPLDRNYQGEVYKEEIRTLSEGSYLCCIDMTPSCDYAQKKAVSSRLLCGVLVRKPDIDPTTLVQGDTSLSISPSIRTYAKDTEFLYIKDSGSVDDGIYKFIFNARYLTTISPEVLRTKDSIMRLRRPIVADYSSWFGGHVARPGYVSIH